MTPITDLKSPHEVVVTINEPVQSGSKNPTKIAKLIFVFIASSVIINWYYFTIDRVFYIRFSSFNQPPSICDVTESLILFVFLCNNIAYVFICLHIFTCSFRGSKVSAVIAACVCIFTSTCWFNQLSTEDIAAIGYALHIAAHFVQAITGMLMFHQLFYIT